MSPLSPDQAPPPRPDPRKLIRSLLPALLIDAVIPYAIYVVGHNVLGWSLITSLAVAAVAPLARFVVRLAQARRVDGLAVLVLLILVFGIGAALITGRPGIAVAREAVFSGGFGLILLGSVIVRRPLIFEFMRKSGGTPESEAFFARRWRAPSFRRAVYIMTAFWAVGLMIEATCRVVYVVTLPPDLAFTRATATLVAILAVLAVGSGIYMRRIRRGLRSDGRG
ncbi:VC0807 family protein [Nonomuraea guangzhouensis]|uniref:VC0807 family protein n=1 Tax=Nonomuraea guangzhouensis TaxID=1291555 RepID=A0ABW4GQH3_9ACTN|nr:VC0807 family protein [Nonomuraea guangzhouensis]